jgi:hypothetical protein
VADKSRLGNPGNGTAHKLSDRRRGAVPPKNESGSIRPRYCVDREDVGGGKEMRNITVLAHLVFANFHPAHKDTQHRSLNVPFRTTQFVNTILYLQTIAIDWNGGLPIENTKKRIDH